MRILQIIEFTQKYQSAIEKINAVYRAGIDVPIGFWNSRYRDAIDLQTLTNAQYNDILGVKSELDNLILSSNDEQNKRLWKKLSHEVNGQANAYNKQYAVYDDYTIKVGYLWDCSKDETVQVFPTFSSLANDLKQKLTLLNYVVKSAFSPILNDLKINEKRNDVIASQTRTKDEGKLGHNAILLMHHYWAKHDSKRKITKMNAASVANDSEYNYNVNPVQLTKEVAKFPVIPLRGSNGQQNSHYIKHYEAILPILKSKCLKAFEEASKDYQKLNPE